MELEQVKNEITEIIENYYFGMLTTDECVNQIVDTVVRNLGTKFNHRLTNDKQFNEN